MPLPDNFKLNVPEKKQYELLPDDTYEVEITKLELKQNEPVFNSTEVEDKLSFEFTVVEEGQYKGRKLWQDTRTIMSAGSNGYSPSSLYKIFCAVNQVKLNDDDTKSVTVSNINDMLSKKLRLVVKQEKNRKGEFKNKIKDMLPLKVNQTFAAHTPVIHTPVEPSQPLESIEDEIKIEDIPF